LRKMRNIEKEWDDAAESWAEFVREGKDYHRDELNNPATFELIGDVKGNQVLDLACGEGYNTRILAKGAKVTGVDFSEKMIDLVRREEARMSQGINYYVMDASNLEKFSSNFFDLATCFMSLQDMKNYGRAISEVSRVLRNQGRFVFSIPHPCFETITVNGKKNAGERYFDAVKYPIEWNMERLERHFRTSSFHRTLTDYFEALFRNKLFVLRLVEPKKPTKKGLQKHPSFSQVLTRPESIVIESVKS
jgi:ubiquinone/menaquinone biosynthesis C-methylase UbiE